MKFHKSSIQHRNCFFDSAYLLKIIRNNLCNSRRFILPVFKFDKFDDPISLEGDEITLRFFHDVFDKDEISQLIEKTSIN